MSNPPATPGWYLNPDDPAQVRWSDGTQWGPTQPAAGGARSGAPPVKFGAAIRLGLTKWTLKGRASRSEYWYVVLALLILNFVLNTATSGMHDGAHTAIVYTTDLAEFCVVTKILVRRYHDIGRSGWWITIQAGVALVAYGFLFTAAANVLHMSAGHLLSQVLSGKHYTVINPHISSSTGTLLGIGIIVGLSVGVWQVVWASLAPTQRHTKWSDV